ncbi:MAG TPA: hypothetical protein VIL51_09945 [Thermoleophilia bacterium]
MLLIGIVLTFLCLRASTRAIRRGVSWWPSNIRSGKVHVHHMVIGLPAMFVIGVVEFTVQLKAPWVEILALCFGGAAATVFDEFALILHLRDVYWEREGRQSVVAVFLGTSFTAFMVIGLMPLGLSGPLSGTAIVRLVAIAALVLNLACVATAFLKDRFWMGWVGLFIPVFAVLAAFRLGRPWSVWARWRYLRRPAKILRAQEHALKFDRRWGRLQSRLADFVAGAPSEVVELPLILAHDGVAFGDEDVLALDVENEGVASI